MRHTYVVTYDISDPKRLRKVYRLMLGWGDHVQLSVFQCELTAHEVIDLRTELTRLIRATEDQVLFIDVGVAASRGPDTITSLGRTYVDPDRTAVVV